MTGYPKILSKNGLLELKDPAKRDHPSFRWGQAAVIKFFAGVKRLPSGNYPSPVHKSVTEQIALKLFYADDEKAEIIINQIISDYQL